MDANQLIKLAKRDVELAARLERHAKAEGRTKSVEDIGAKIKIAERKQKTGKRESVLLTNENLRDILTLVERHDILAAQAIRKAINVGLKALVLESEPPKIEIESGKTPEGETRRMVKFVPITNTESQMRVIEKSIYDDIDAAKDRLAQATAQRDAQDEEDAFTPPPGTAIQTIGIGDVPSFLQGTGAATV